MEKILIALKAQAQHGKDTVVNILVEEFDFVRVAFADPLKEAALALDPYVLVERLLFFQQMGGDGSRYKEFMRLSTLLALVNGWDAAKQHPDVRRLLQRLGTEVGRDILGPKLGHEDHLWIDITENTVAPLQKAAIADLRFPNEGTWTHDRDGWIWDIFRPNFDNGVDINHPSEKFVKEIPHDYQLLNVGGPTNFKDILREQVIKGLEIIAQLKARRDQW